MDENKKKEVENAKKAISKMDPELVMMAIRQADVDQKEVAKIKDFLSKCDANAVQYALAEINQESMTKEIKGIQAQLKDFSRDNIHDALEDMGIKSRIGPRNCFEEITSCGFGCIQLMITHCMQDMYVRYRDFEDLINPGIFGGIVNRAVVKALKTR